MPKFEARSRIRKRLVTNWVLPYNSLLSVFNFCCVGETFKFSIHGCFETRVLLRPMLGERNHNLGLHVVSMGSLCFYMREESRFWGGLLEFVPNLCHFKKLHNLKARVYTENTSDAWHIPRKHCITSMYCIVLLAPTSIFCIQIFHLNFALSATNKKLMKHKIGNVHSTKAELANIPF